MSDFWSDFDWADIVQKAVIAVIILVVTWLLARAVRWAFAKLVGRIGFLEKQGTDGQTLGASLGQIGALLIWLFGLMAILNLFGLERVMEPISSLLDTILSYLPNIIGAGFVFFIGFVIARILKQVVETALGAANLDRLGARLSPGSAADSIAGSDGGSTTSSATTTAGGSDLGSRIPTVVGNLVFAVVLIVVSIAALQILEISAISDPAENMLTIILNAIPLVLAAAVILGIGYVISQFAGSLLEGTLQALGTDRAVASLDIVPEGRSASTVLTRIVQVAIMTFFAIMAARVLNFPEITAILNEILALGGRVVFGGAIIAVGFVVANLLARMVGDGMASQVVKIATIVLFVAMGLQYMGIADSIINLAFGAVVVGGALAAAIAYGLGGRDAAARSLQRMQDRPPASPAGPSSTGPSSTGPSSTGPSSTMS